MPDDDILVRMHNIIREHLPCEVWMLNFCHQALCTRGVLGQLPVNVLIELAPVSLDTTLSTGTEKEWPS